ncbi:MAG TPA: hypothetical protein VF169_20635 [Albitalea sp.]
MIPIDIHDSLCVASVRPSATVEGLDIVLVIGGTLRVEALVTRQALEKRWRARHTGDAMHWLAAYEKNRRAIHSCILRQHRPGAKRVIVDARSV